MVLACQNICKAFGVDEILQNVSFRVEANERAAIVGINGAGKTTLLRIIMQELGADEGEVILAKGCSMGYLPQNPEIEGNRTIYQEILSAKEHVIGIERRILEMEGQMQAIPPEEMDSYMGAYHRLQQEFEQLDGYTYKSEIVGVLKGLGFSQEEYEKRMQELSGGQRTRVCLGKLLVTRPDIILLDEPTNHLDIGAIAWLENFLVNYRGTVILVSHDRFFLDKVVNKVIELDRARAAAYQGNYTDYAKKRAQAREALLRQYYNQQREIQHQEEVIAKLRSFNREKSIKRAESREKLLGKMERMEKPTEENTDIKLSLEPRIVSGNDVLKAEGLSKSYPGQQLFRDLNFEVKRGERVALIGDNGTGKTTILKIINDMIPADSGRIVLGTNVHIGYYDQAQETLSPEKTLIQEISDDYPDLTEGKIRNVLAAFLFTGDEAFKHIRELSGGERGRLSLAKLMLSEANFLILDEPTNHLDMASKEILEHALNQYAGTVLYVSHDRYFINQTATRIWNLTGETLVNYLGNYDYYLEKCRELTEVFAPASASLRQRGEKEAASESEGKLKWKQSKEEQARRRKLDSDLRKTEDAIASAEGRIAKIEAQFADPDIATNSMELGRLQKEYDRTKQELESLYERWEDLEMQRT